MREEFRFDYEAYDGPANLPAADRALCEKAKQSAHHAWAPYSGFRVGTAARLRSGAVLTASNQESGVLPAGMCAERIALFDWQAGHSDDPVEAIAIASIPGTRECSPCGQCRQTLLDVETRQGSPIRVVMCSDTTCSVVDSAKNLLPFHFSL